MGGLARLTTPVIHSPDIRLFTVIGDPGCDGLGTAAMSVLAQALTVGETDLRIIAGDIVPFGSRPLYENVRELIDTVAASSPVYALRGNHDTEFFHEYFGLENFAIVTERLLILALDDARRGFDDATLAFCRSTLENHARDHIVAMFHIPPPNAVTANAIPGEQWDKLRKILQPYSDKIDYIVCGHLHSYFETSVDGFALIVTGGGGARIERLNDAIDEKSVRHHVVEFYFDAAGSLARRYVPLGDDVYRRELQDAPYTGYLENAFKNECVARFRYRLFAEMAARQGAPGLADLFYALSESEYHHARNHFYALGRQKTLLEHLGDSVATETDEIDNMYKKYRDYAEANRFGLAKYAFHDAREAEKVHKELLEKALSDLNEGRVVEEKTYYTCSSCGYTFRTERHPERCPVCGAPKDKIVLSRRT